MDSNNEKTRVLTFSEPSVGSSGAAPDVVVRIDALEEKTKKLESKADGISKSLEKSEKNQDKALNFMMGIAGIIIVAFFLALIPLLFDYYKDSAEKYENFTKRIDNLDMRVKTLENKN